MEQIERIKHMEEIMDKATEVLAELRKAFEKYEDMKSEIDELEEYYGSELWNEDFDADSEGKLPKDLKRGILSEDGIWDLLLERDELVYQFRNMESDYPDTTFDEDDDDEYDNFNYDDECDDDCCHDHCDCE